MEISTTIDGASATITLVGKLTVATAPELKAVFASLPEDVTDISLDLAEVAYIASAGLRTIVACEKQLRTNGGGLRLLNPNDDVMEILEVTGLVDILAIEQ